MVCPGRWNITVGNKKTYDAIEHNSVVGFKEEWGFKEGTYFYKVDCKKLQIVQIVDWVASAPK